MVDDGFSCSLDSRMKPEVFIWYRSNFFTLFPYWASMSVHTIRHLLPYRNVRSGTKTDRTLHKYYVKAMRAHTAAESVGTWVGLADQDDSFSWSADVFFCPFHPDWKLLCNCGIMKFVCPTGKKSIPGSCNTTEKERKRRTRGVRGLFKTFLLGAFLISIF